MPTIESVADKIECEGEPVILRRVGAPDLSGTAFIRGYRPNELVAGIDQGDREARMSDRDIAAAGWPGPPVNGDKLVIRGRTARVESCATMMLRGAPAMHVIQVRG